MSKDRGNKISQKEREILDRYDQLKYRTDVLGPGSALTLQTHTNSSRLIMVNHQIGHAVNIRDPEPALVSTGFENILAEESIMNEKADRSYRIVHILMKNPYNGIIIGYNEETRHYHAWKRKEIEEHSEGFATRYKNSLIDSLDVGDVIKKGAYLTKSEAIDKYGNYCIGRNLNTVYIISPTVLEDGIGLMNGAEKKLVTSRCFTISVPLNDNEVLLNLYGDKTVYKTFPNVGEKIKGGILAAVRTIDNAKAPYSLKDRSLRDAEEGDRKYNQTGRVIDIRVRYNKDRSSLIDAKTNRQVNAVYIEQQEYYLQVYKTMNEIVKNADDEGYTYSDEFSLICSEARSYVDASAFFSDFNENIFGNMIIDFTVVDEEPMAPGSKMVGRSGNKGVIAKIFKPEESWFMEDGTPVEVLVSALGVVGRLNPSQLNEHSINDLTTTARRRMSQVDDVDEKFKILYELLVILNKDEAKDLKKYFKALDAKDKKKFCKNVEQNGVYVVQDPIDNVNILDLEKAYDKYPANWQRIVFPDGSRSIRKLLCAKIYYLRLKQDPKDKYSARGRGPVNTLHGMPTKSNRRKKFLDLFSDVPVRLGNAEIDVLNNCNEPAAVADYMAENSTSGTAKDMMAKAYTIDPAEEDAFFDSEALIDGVDFMEGMTKNNADMLYAHLQVLGSTLEFIYEGDEDNQGEGIIPISGEIDDTDDLIDDEDTADTEEENDDDEF